MKCLILQYLYDLSDPALEDALIDRLSFQRFLGISFDTEILDFTTKWFVRMRLIKGGLLTKIFDTVLIQLATRNVIHNERTLVDAMLFQAARRNKNDRGKNESDRSSRQDHYTTSTQKGVRQYYGYNDHIGVDNGSNIIRRVRFHHGLHA